MTTALYRINGGEVVKISATNQQFDAVDSNYWGVATDPAFPDGTQNRENDSGPLRVLGFAKFMDVPGGICRNATQGEIDNFAVAETADENIMDRDGARDLLQQHPRFRKLMAAYSKLMVQEFNLVRGWTRDMKAAVDASANLAQFKANVAALPTLNDRTISQLKTALINEITEND